MRYFPDERRSPRVSALDVLKYASPHTAGLAGENPCAALLIEKISHLRIGNYSVLKCIFGWALVSVARGEQSDKSKLNSK